MRIDSSTGGMPLIGGTAGTPESLTLSVDSLPQQRHMYQSEAHNQLQATTIPIWRRSPIIDITNTRRVEHPPQYPIQQVVMITSVTNDNNTNINTLKME